MKKQKLELTWIGKENRPRLEPRILLENPEYSHHAAHRVGDNDIFDNVLIKGDNLLALKALEQEYSGMVKCVYIDPPFNTQQAFEHYDDGVEHSLWLSLLRDRLELLRALMAEDGSIFVHIDDNELGYLIVLLDEIFGRNNQISIITFKQGSATGHKSINPGCVKTSNFLLAYAKDKSKWSGNRLYTARERDKRYGQYIQNKQAPFEQWEFVTLAKAFALSNNVPEKEAKKRIKDYDAKLDQFVIDNAENVVRLAQPSYEGVSAAARSLVDQSRTEANRIFLLERDGYSDMYLVNGQRILFYSDKLKLIDGEYVAGEPLTTIWDDLLSNNLHNEGGVEFPKGKKPESLLHRVLQLSTNPGDLVLDSFGGSGTTGAVAHKMGRRWIMVELGDHCETHIVPRLKKVVDGEDPGGITKAVEWKGGGGFRYYTLAPSLLEKDRWDNWVINKEYNAAMLAQAMCKHEGFSYAPSETIYWQQGQSSETDFIYTTTQTLTHDQLALISEEVGPNRTLLICCCAFRARTDAFPNLTVKKIPRVVMNRCEFGRDDYSLQVQNLPPAPVEEEPEPTTTPRRAGGSRGRSAAADSPSLFEADEPDEPDENGRNEGEVTA